MVGDRNGSSQPDLFELVCRLDTNPIWIDPWTPVSDGINGDTPTPRIFMVNIRVDNFFFFFHKTVFKTIVNLIFNFPINLVVIIFNLTSI